MVTACAAALALHQAVGRNAFLVSSLPLPQQELLRHTDVDEIPGEQLICFSLVRRVEGDVDARFLKGFQPELIMEMLGPGIEKTALLVSKTERL